MNRTCVERKWTFERNYQRKPNRRKVPSRKKAGLIMLDDMKEKKDLYAEMK